MIKRSTFIIAAILFLALLGVAIFLFGRSQIKTINELSLLFKEEPIVSPQPAEDLLSEQIAQLKQEVEELKQQQAKTAEKSELKPASSPSIDLKTQEELNRAKEQINSLGQQLAQLQKQSSQAPASVSDADLLKSWQADEKVAQVACQNKFMGSWQMGSGVLISADGKILTNQHVVQSSLGLTMPDYCLILFSKDFDAQTQSYKKQYRATIAGLFDNRDAVVLKIQDVLFKDSAGNVQSIAPVNTFSYFKIASSQPQIGDPVYVLGFPESANFAFSVTKGIISNLTSGGLYFGTDAQIDRGNSGGAAVNSSGQLIGLPTYKFVSSGDYRGYILDIQTIKLTP